ncbi:M61 family metallopeptidase [Ottowia testudinis]|uniref:M61 family metallopeptidase n=1 Tax=Ottowia testudinis TaxID=2816950 RepID=A0A975CJD7_9BURK|nr:M61 family metallopeptidase [Ottowia testudinis]QTD46166.1 M61 family metallopeptidase [Ottowia testudinis]
MNTPPRRTRRAPAAQPPPAPVRHDVRMASLTGHRFAVQLRIEQPAATQRVSLPVWIPGSYLIREFARHLLPLHAAQGRAERTCRQIGKSTWDIDCDPRRPLVLRYEVYAFDASVRTAWLDAERGFFNGTSLLLRVHGQEAAPHELTVHTPRERRDWQLATAMTPVEVDAQGFGRYRADGYDELVDHPVELGAFWSGEFTAGGVPHRFVVAGAPPSFDGARLLRDAKKICEAAIRLWHGASKPPFDHYLFILNAVGDGYGGLEHRASTALICARHDLPQADSPASAAAVGDGYVTLLGLISHEYFHAWNVKRLRPAEFDRYDYQSENHTRLLWFFEGFTSYYDDLLLRRAGLIDDTAYLKLLTKTINQVLQAPGRQVQSVAQASFDAWLRYYRPDENTPNSTISYYTKGALVALCFDLTLRAEGRTTLDDVMRALWQRCAGGPMTEGDFADTLARLAGRPFDAEIATWIHGTAELPLRPLLEAQGVRVLDEPSQLAQTLGLRVSEDGGITLKVVLDGGAAARAGMAAGDEWLGVELPAVRASGTPASGWRLTRLDDLPLYAGAARQITALVARDKRLLRLPLRLPEKSTTWRLAPKDRAEAPAWLAR